MYKLLERRLMSNFFFLYVHLCLNANNAMLINKYEKKISRESMAINGVFKLFFPLSFNAQTQFNTKCGDDEEIDDN